MDSVQQCTSPVNMYVNNKTGTSDYVALFQKPTLHYSRNPERIGNGIMLIFKYNFPVF